MKVLFVFGTRPEAIKMAPVIKEMISRPQQFEVSICVTAQHREMLDDVLSLFKIEPDYDLNLMQPNQSLSALTGRIFTELAPVVEKEKPDWLLVQGDTTTVMAASIVAYYYQIRVGHVEAGLRTDDKYQPFPEEINRRIVSVVGDLHFAPTEKARQNLLHDGIDPKSIVITGNTVIDALLQVSAFEYDLSQGPLSKINFKKRVVLVTAHRRENFGKPIREICRSILTLHQKYPDIEFAYPVHLNPNIQKPVYELLGNTNGISLLSPLDYFSLVHLMKQCTLVMTDSGGIQEEAPSLGKPVLVLRNVTERPEGVEAGTAKLMGTDHDRIVHEISTLMDDEFAYNEMANAVNPYGDGQAAEYICDAMENK